MSALSCVTDRWNLTHYVSAPPNGDGAMLEFDDLQHIVEENQERRSKEALAAQRIVQDETHEFTRWLRAHRAGLDVGLRHKTPSTS